MKLNRPTALDRQMVEIESDICATYETTYHAQVRMQQRGFRGKDAELVMECGTDYTEGRIVLLDRDVVREVRDCKRRIQKLQRLRGSVVVLEDGHLVTCYHLHRKKERHVLRGPQRRHRRAD